MIIDSHAHLSRWTFDGAFRFLDCSDGVYEIKDGTRADILEKLAENGIVGVIEPAVELETNRALLDFCGKQPGFFPAVGVHPTRIGNLRMRDGKTLSRYAAENGVVAIGETGLDYHLQRKEQRTSRFTS